MIDLVQEFNYFTSAVYTNIFVFYNLCDYVYTYVFYRRILME